MQNKPRIIRALLFIAVLSASTLQAGEPLRPVSPDASASIEQEVLATNAAMVAAANRLDMDAFFSHIADSDRGLIVQNGVIFANRQAAREAVERGLRGVAKIDRRFTDPKVTVVSSDTALLVSEGTVVATLDDGRVMTSRFAVSIVFVKRPEGWRVLHGHYSMPAMN